MIQIPRELTYYRPISLVSAISKVIEKLTKIQLNKFIISKNALNNMQFGFREITGNEDTISHFANLI